MGDVGRRVDVEDEDARLGLYRSSFDDPGWRPGLLSCLALEPDPALATSVLASLLEVVAPVARHSVLSAAPASGAEFLASRAGDLELFELLHHGTPAGEQTTVADVTLASLLDGSDWLQRRVAEESVATTVLAALADRGRTRKVRARAAQRIRFLSKP